MTISLCNGTRDSRAHVQWYRRRMGGGGGGGGGEGGEDRPKKVTRAAQT